MLLTIPTVLLLLGSLLSLRDKVAELVQQGFLSLTGDRLISFPVRRP